jgi:O-acetyl-ADP-ribose deacetylase (regulator of RNase III)
MIEIVYGDITKEETEAIVNAANSSLLGGGGVDGAIHLAAGPELLAECNTLGGCPTGQARLTKGYRLQAKWVIHTVGPVWRGGELGEDDQLARAYRSVLAIAHEKGMRSLSFPAISTGVYGFPGDRAAQIAVREVLRFLAQNEAAIEKIRFVCYDRRTVEFYRYTLETALTNEG